MIGRDCREVIETHICLSCRFPKKVSIDRIARWEDDRKNGGGYTFEIPTLPLNLKDLTCYGCGHHMVAVGYYTLVHERFCEQEKERADLIRTGKVCVNCNKIEGIDWGFHGRIKLQVFKGRQICQTCVVDAVKQDNPDPSDAVNKFTFDESKLEWVLYRVKIACKTCTRSHWVKVTERSWRKQCKSCFSRR